MNPPNVLIADDEIPYGDERDQQTREAFRKTRPKATEESYLRGYKAMQGSCQALQNAEFNLKIARRFKEAENEIRNTKVPFDVAIVDYGWAADLDLEDRDNAGKRLVKVLRDSGGGHHTRIIMYSSRFDAEETLAETARQLGTLPLLKTYTKASHQTLVAAVRFLASPKPTPAETVFSMFLATAEGRQKQLRTLSTVLLILIIVVGIVLLGGVAMLWGGDMRRAGLTTAASVLVTTFLGFICKQISAEVKNVLTVINEAKKLAQDMRAPQRRTEKGE